MRDAVGRSRMPRDDFHRCFVEGNIEQIGRFPRKRHDIGPHPRGLRVDIDPDDPLSLDRHGCTDDETGLGAGASRAMHDGGRREARCAACGSISQSSRHRRSRPADSRRRRARRRACTRAWDRREPRSRHCGRRSRARRGGRAEQPVEEGVAGGLVFRCRGSDPPVIDRKMACEAELRGGGRDLALAVRLHDAAGDHRIGAAAIASAARSRACATCCRQSRARSHPRA